MSELPISSPYRSTPDVPVDDAERNQLSSRLNDAFTDGTLDEDEYHRRLDRLFAAQKLGELVPVVEGLPPRRTYENPSIVGGGTGEPGTLTQARSGNTLSVVTVGIIGIGVLVVLVLLLVLIF